MQQPCFQIKNFRVLVTGAGGMLGKELCLLLRSHNRLNAEVFSFTKNDLDIRNASNVESVFSRTHPDVVINCAAYTAVDDCQTDHSLAFSVNAHGTRTVARACKRHKSLLIHVSTDYIFDGLKPIAYVETDSPNPLNVYGESKLDGERAIMEEAPEFLIIRTSWLFGPYGMCFPQRIIHLSREKKELRIVNDQRGSPTYTLDLAEAITALISTNARGIFHVTNSGVCTWFDLGKETLRLAGIATPVVAISSSEMPRPARRPTNSALDCTKFLKTTGMRLRDWRAALKHWFERFGFENRPTSSSLSSP